MNNFGNYILPANQGGGGGVTSGSVLSGSLGPSIVFSGNIASGQVGNPHFASGAAIDLARRLFEDSLLTGEPISGGSTARAVCLSQSGTLLTAMGSVSGRMPAIGVVTSNYLSGIAAQVYRDGLRFADSFSFSGFPNTLAYVGSSGAVSTHSGIPLLSGNEQQVLGVIVSNSGLMLGVM